MYSFIHLTYQKNSTAQVVVDQSYHTLDLVINQSKISQCLKKRKKENRLGQVETNGQISHNQVEMCEEKVTAIHTPTSSFTHLLAKQLLSNSKQLVLIHSKKGPLPGHVTVYCRVNICCDVVLNWSGMSSYPCLYLWCWKIHVWVDKLCVEMLETCCEASLCDKLVWSSSWLLLWQLLCQPADYFIHLNFQPSILYLN